MEEINDIRTSNSVSRNCCPTNSAVPRALVMVVAAVAPIAISASVYVSAAIPGIYATPAQQRVSCLGRKRPKELAATESSPHDAETIPRIPC